MNLLRGTKVYLAGPIEFSSEAVNWRHRLASTLGELGIKTYDPLVKPDWYPSLCKGNPKMYLAAAKGEDKTATPEAIGEASIYLRDVCLRMAHDCDFMIVNLPREFTLGTIEELTIAINTKKPVFILNKDKFPGMWCLGMVEQKDWDTTFFRDLDALENHIRLIDRGEVELDPLRWLSVSYFNKEAKYVRHHIPSGS